MPPSSGNRRDRLDTVMAEGRKKKTAAIIQRTNEPEPACAAAATHLRLKMAQMSKKTRSRRRSSRRRVVAGSLDSDFICARRIVSDSHLIKGSQQLLSAGIRAGSISSGLNT